jgi:hypothetical protein
MALGPMWRWPVGNKAINLAFWGPFSLVPLPSASSQDRVIRKNTNYYCSVLLGKQKKGTIKTEKKILKLKINSISCVTQYM